MSRSQGRAITHRPSRDLARQAVGDGIVPAISDREVRCILAEVDLQPHRTRSSKTACLDDRFNERAEKVLWCYANVAGQDVWVHLGTGDGTFRPAVPVPVGQPVYSVISADFNADGKPDLLAFIGNTDSFGVMLNQGDGTFAPEVVTKPGAQIGYVRAGDFDQDGRPDLVASTLYGDALLLGRGDGTFSDPVYYAAGPARPGVVLDYNGDGKPDLVVPRDMTFTFTGPVVTVLENTFAPPPLTLTLAPIADRSVSEGSGAVTLTATAAVSVPGHRLTFSLDPGAPAGATIDPTTGAFSFDAAQGPATHSVTVRVTDADAPALSTTQSFLITVANVAPVVNVGADASALAGVLFARDASFTDPGLQTWAASVDYGDGDGPQPLRLDPDRTFHLRHVYAQAGTFPVTVVVTDSGGASGTGTFSADVTTLQPTEVGTTLATPVVGESGGTVDFTVTREGDRRGTSAVQYATEDGTAQAGTDYLPAAGTLVFGPGEVSKTVTVGVLPNVAVRGPRTFRLGLNGPVGMTLGPQPTATATITSTTQPGQLVVAPAAVVVRQGSPQATVRVARVGGTDGEVTVHYDTTDGSARDGVDYKAASGTLTFEWGVASQDVVIPLLPGSAAGASRSFTLSLSDPAGGAALGTAPQGSVTIAGAGSADLALSATASDRSVAVGQELRFTLTATNNGPAAAPDVAVTDVLPGNATFVSAASSRGVVSRIGGKVRARLGTLAPGAVATITIVVRPSAAGTLSDTATVSATNFDDLNPSNNAATATARATAVKPPPTPAVPPHVTKLQRFGYHAQPTLLVLTFDHPLDTARASDPANYRVSMVTSGPSGRTAGRPVALGAVTYDAASQTVTIVPRQPLNLHRIYRITVVGEGPKGVAGASDTLLDGAGTGKAGSNFSAEFGRNILAGTASDWLLRRSPTANAFGSLRTPGAAGTTTPRTAIASAPSGPRPSAFRNRAVAQRRPPGAAER